MQIFQSLAKKGSQFSVTYPNGTKGMKTARYEVGEFKGKYRDMLAVVADTSGFDGLGFDSTVGSIDDSWHTVNLFTQNHRYIDTVAVAGADDSDHAIYVALSQFDYLEPDYGKLVANSPESGFDNLGFSADTIQKLLDNPSQNQHYLPIITKKMLINEQNKASFDDVAWDGLDLVSHGRSFDNLYRDMLKHDTFSELTEKFSLRQALAQFDDIGELGFDSLMDTHNRLQLMGDRLYRALVGAGNQELQVTSFNLTKPFKRQGVANVAMEFGLSDGQSFSIFFKNPSADPAKIGANDVMVSWKWLLNKKDITAVVQPENGADVQLSQVAMRMIKLAKANMKRFASAQAQKAKNEQEIKEAQQAVADKQALVETLDREIADLQAQIDAKRHEPKQAFDDDVAVVGENQAENQPVENTSHQFKFELGQAYIDFSFGAEAWLVIGRRLDININYGNATEEYIAINRAGITNIGKHSTPERIDVDRKTGLAYQTKLKPITLDEDMKLSLYKLFSAEHMAKIYNQDKTNFEPQGYEFLTLDELLNILKVGENQDKTQQDDTPTANEPINLTGDEHDNEIKDELSDSGYQALPMTTEQQAEEKNKSKQLMVKYPIYKQIQELLEEADFEEYKDSDIAVDKDVAIENQDEYEYDKVFYDRTYGFVKGLKTLFEICHAQGFDIAIGDFNHTLSKGLFDALGDDDNSVVVQIGQGGKVARCAIDDDGHITVLIGESGDKGFRAVKYDKESLIKDYLKQALQESGLMAGVEDEVDEPDEEINTLSRDELGKAYTKNINNTKWLERHQKHLGHILTIRMESIQDELRRFGFKGGEHGDMSIEDVKLVITTSGTKSDVDNPVHVTYALMQNGEEKFKTMDTIENKAIDFAKQLFDAYQMITKADVIQDEPVATLNPSAEDTDITKSEVKNLEKDFLKTAKEFGFNSQDVSKETYNLDNGGKVNQYVINVFFDNYPEVTLYTEYHYNSSKGTKVISRMSDDGELWLIENNPVKGLQDFKDYVEKIKKSVDEDTPASQNSEPTQGNELQPLPITFQLHKEFKKIVDNGDGYILAELTADDEFLKNYDFQKQLPFAEQRKVKVGTYILKTFPYLAQGVDDDTYRYTFAGALSTAKKLVKEFKNSNIFNNPHKGKTWQGLQGAGRIIASKFGNSYNAYYEPSKEMVFINGDVDEYIANDNPQAQLAKEQAEQEQARLAEIEKAEQEAKRQAQLAEMKRREQEMEKHEQRRLEHLAEKAGLIEDEVMPAFEDVKLYDKRGNKFEAVMRLAEQSYEAKQLGFENNKGFIEYLAKQGYEFVKENEYSDDYVPMEYRSKFERRGGNYGSITTHYFAKLDDKSYEISEAEYHYGWYIKARLKENTSMQTTQNPNYTQSDIDYLNRIIDGTLQLTMANKDEILLELERIAEKGEIDEKLLDDAIMTYTNFVASIKVG